MLISIDNPDVLNDSYPDPEHFHCASIAEDVDARIRRILISRLEKVIKEEEKRIETALNPNLNPSGNPSGSYPATSTGRGLGMAPTLWFYGIIIILMGGFLALNIFLISQSQKQQAEQMNVLIEAIEDAVTDK